MLYTRRRRGFTLVELLVVIAIIGTLVAMLMPAVQSARESARRMQCTNHMRNLALACTHYHDSLNSFPNSHFYQKKPNSICGASPNPAMNCEQWGWHVLILPYIEQQNLFSQLDVLSYSLHQVLAKQPPPPDPNDPSSGPDATLQATLDAKIPLLQMKIPVFLCPSDAGTDLVPTERDFRQGMGTTAGGLGNFRPSTTNYMCNRGTHINAQPINDTHGIFMESHGKRVNDITDGTSNTFLLGERESQICRSGTWIGVRNPVGAGTRGIYNGAANVSVRLNAPDPPIPWNDTTTRQGCYEGFSSLHLGGANFALADGSVRFVSNNIEFKPRVGSVQGVLRATSDPHTPKNPQWEPVYSVYSRLGRRNDGYAVGDY